jgi:hypothetical protein
VSKDAKVFSETEERRGEALGLFFNNGKGFSRHRAYHYRNLGFYDPGLFRGDLRDGLSQIGLMIQAYVGDDRYLGVDHVRGIKPPAETTFHHRNLHPLFRKEKKGQGCSELEIGVRKIPKSFFHPGAEGDKTLFRDRTAIHDESFTHRDEVGRGIKTGSRAVVPEEALLEDLRGRFGVESVVLQY